LTALSGTVVTLLGTYFIWS